MAGVRIMIDVESRPNFLSTINDIQLALFCSFVWGKWALVGSHCWRRQRKRNSRSCSEKYQELANIEESQVCQHKKHRAQKPEGMPISSVSRWWRNVFVQAQPGVLSNRLIQIHVALQSCTSTDVLHSPFWKDNLHWSHKQRFLNSLTVWRAGPGILTWPC